MRNAGWLSICCWLCCGAAAGASDQRSIYLDAARNAVSVGDHEQALRRFDAAAALAPLDADQELERAQVLIASGRAGVAVATLRRLSAQHPRRLDFAEALTRALLAAGEPGQAAALIEEDEAPGEPETDAAPPSGATELSIEELQGRLDARPGDHWVTRELGRALAAAGRHRQALPHLLATLAHFPGDLRVRQDLGLSLLRVGRPADAAPELRQVLAAEPGNTLVRDRLADALARVGRHREAVSQIDRLAEEPRRTERRALSQARVARSAAELRELEELFAGSAERRLGLALAHAHLRLGAPESAAEVLDELIAGGAGDAEVLRLALRARRAADLDTTPLLAELRRLHPRDRDLARDHGDALELAGRPAEAAAIWASLHAAGARDDDLRRLVLAAWAAGDTALVVAHARSAVLAHPGAGELAGVGAAALAAHERWTDLLAITPWKGATSALDELRRAEALPAEQSAVALVALWRAAPHPPVARALARALVQAGRHAEGLALLAEESGDLDSAADDLLRARSQLALGRADEARAILDAPPLRDDPAAAPDRAELALYDGEPERALAELRSHWRTRPDDLAGARRLARLLAWRALHAPPGGDDRDRADALVDSLESRHRADPALGAAAARYHAGRGRPAAAYRRLEELAGGERERRLALLADIRAASGQPHGAVAAADSLAHLARPPLARARALVAAEHRDRARELLHAARAADPSDPFVLLELRQLDRLSAPLVPPAPPPEVDHPSVLEADRLMAQVREVAGAGRAGAGVAILDSLVAVDGPSIAARLALARLLAASGRPVEALDHFQLLLRSAPGRVDWAMEEARALTAAGRKREALAAWAVLVEGGAGRADIALEAEAASRELRGDLDGALERYRRLASRWADHRPAIESARRLQAVIELEHESRRIALGTLSPRPGPGMPLAYEHPAAGFGAESGFASSARRGREGRLALATTEIDLAAGTLWGAELALSRSTHSHPTDSQRAPIAFHALSARSRLPRDPATPGWGLVGDAGFALGGAGVGDRLDGGLGLSYRRDPQSVLLFGVEQRPWAENLDTVLRGDTRRTLLAEIGASILDHRLRLSVGGDASSLSDDNYFWSGRGRLAVALGPRYQTLVLGAEIGLRGFHRQSDDYYSPRRESRLLGVLGLGRRPAADEPAPSPWSWGLECGFGVEDAPLSSGALQPIGRIDAHLARPLGPLALCVELERLLAPDYHEGAGLIVARWEF